MARHRHKFERLSDAAIFCACGEMREAPVVPATWAPVTVPVCTRQHYPMWYGGDWTYYPTLPVITWDTVTTTTVADKVPIGSTYVLNGTEQVTYTTEVRS